MQNRQPGRALISYPNFFVSLGTLCMTICATIAVFSISAGLLSMPTYLYLFEHKQLVADWSTRPFVDIRLENYEESGGCALDYEPVFSRMWNGTYELCVEDLNVRVFDVENEEDICDGDIRN